MIDGLDLQGDEAIEDHQPRPTFRWVQVYYEILGKGLREPISPEEFAEREPFWNAWVAKRQCKEDFNVHVINLTPEEADAFQVIQLYCQRADAANVFDELKNQWGFAEFCSQKAAVSQSSARMLLLIYNLWSLFVRVLENQGGHTEAIKCRYKLLLIPAKLAVGSKFASFLKQTYQRLGQWLSRTAPQLSLSMGKAPPWLLFDPTQTTSSDVT